MIATSLVRQWLPGISIAGGLVLGLTLPLTAQLRMPELQLDSITETDVAHAGTRVNVALEVALDPGFHLQSNAPLDPSLIPTVLTLDPPDGFSVESVAFPEAILLDVAGDALAVFEEEFRIGALVDVSDSVAPGTYTVPGTLRWQACNEPDATDGLVVEITNTGGAPWTQVDHLVNKAGGWLRHCFRVSDFVTPTANVKVRFMISDTVNPICVR